MGTNQGTIRTSLQTCDLGGGYLITYARTRTHARIAQNQESRNVNQATIRESKSVTISDDTIAH